MQRRPSLASLRRRPRLFCCLSLRERSTRSPAVSVARRFGLTASSLGLAPHSPGRRWSRSCFGGPSVGGGLIRPRRLQSPPFWRTRDDERCAARPPAYRARRPECFKGHPEHWPISAPIVTTMVPEADMRDAGEGLVPESNG